MAMPNLSPSEWAALCRAMQEFARIDGEDLLGVLLKTSGHTILDGNGIVELARKLEGREPPTGNIEVRSDVLEAAKQQREVLAALLKASERFWVYVNVYSDPVLEHEATLALHRARNKAHKVLGTKMPELDWHGHLQQFVPKKDRA